MRFWYIASSRGLIGMPISVALPTPTTQTSPALRMAVNASAMCAPVVTPMLTMALSAP